MILIFLGSWRSTLIIATSIPLAILTSIIVLSIIGQTINIMTLGGLALAVGILVDDATVEVENINRNREAEPDKNLDEVVLDSAMQIATPAFVSTLSICIVFAPMFLLSGVARYLFLPLAEAVVFAMLASYFLSRTIVPTMAKYLLRGQTAGEHAAASRNVFVRLQKKFESGFEAFRNAIGACWSVVSSIAWLFCWLSSQPASDRSQSSFRGSARTSFPASTPEASSFICVGQPACALKTRLSSAIEWRMRSESRSRPAKWKASSTTSACHTAASIFPTAIRRRSGPPMRTSW